MENVYSKTARYYDKLYAKKDYVGEVQRLISLLGVESDQKQLTMLDVACGTGLHIEHLRRHFHVEGLDICPELLEVARDFHRWRSAPRLNMSVGQRRDQMKPDGLITYCGGFCGTCARCLHYTAFRDAARLLAELTDAHNFQHWLPRETKNFDYAEFRKGLDFFANPESWLVCKRGCRGGQGGPPWCGFPCSRVKENKPMMERGEEYRRLGRSEWLQRQVEKADQGFAGRTGKYYRVCISDSPPSS